MYRGNHDATNYEIKSTNYIMQNQEHDNPVAAAMIMNITLMYICKHDATNLLIYINEPQMNNHELGKHKHRKNKPYKDQKKEVLKLLGRQSLLKPPS